MTSVRVAIAAIVFLTLAASATVYFYVGERSVVPLVAAVFNFVVRENGVDVTRGIAYGPSQRQKLDIYRPLRGVHRARPKETDNSPIAIFLYGGSWQQGERGQYEFVGKALARKGITTVIPDYRLYPEVKFPAFMNDAADAYAFVARKLGQRVDGHQRPIVLIGHSAGAHMAALLTLDKSYLAARGPDIPPPSALIGLAGPYSFDPTTWPTTKAVFADVAGHPDVARPVTFAKSGGPPTLLMHGLKDTTTKIVNMQDLARELQAAGTDVQTLELAKIGHVGILTSMAKPLRGWAPVLQAIREFMMRHANLEAEPRLHTSNPVKAPKLKLP